MSKIIVFGSRKGGVGKSTVSVLAANALSQEPFNQKVTVIDTDQQKSISKLRLMDAEDFDEVLPYEVLNYNVPTFEKNIKDLDSRNDIILVDVAGKLDTSLPVEQQEISRVINYVDFLFIPFVSGNFGLESTLDYLKFVLQFQAKRKAEGRPFQIIGFVNMHRERTRNSRFLISEIDQLKNMISIPFMKTPIKEYTLFRDADTLESLYQLNSSDNAKSNFTEWMQEFNLLIQ